MTHQLAIVVALAVALHGNDPTDAGAIARAVLSRQWPAQVLDVRVDRAGAHAVAGLMLSGVKLKRRVGPAAFLADANRMIDVALSAAPVEEVDLWVVVPRAPGVLDTVFTLTVRRGASNRHPYWDPRWRAGLAPPAANR
ncbi:MAG: hypothetical protein JOY59_03095 [Candidatus Eremiobacteraeota bacterium]|nr:hypothetical protein [Candidatus Eremiobacteraeota bacterium]